MSLLAPLYLAGLAAVGLPLAFHLLRRTPRNRVEFGTTMFLREMPPRVTRRSRLEHWPLLLLRACVVCLLAAAFARPFLRDDSSTTVTATSRRTVVLIDTSASMRRDGLWDAALANVEELVADAEPAVDFAIVGFDGTSHTWLSFERFRELPETHRGAAVRRALNDVEPSWHGTDLGLALQSAVGVLRDDGSATEATGQIVVVSDWQDGMRTEALTDFDWPTDVAISRREIAVAGPSNAGLQLVGEPSVAEDGRTSFRVRVANAAGSSTERFDLRWADGSRATSLTVPAGEVRTVSMELPERSAGTATLQLVVTTTRSTTPFTSQRPLRNASRSCTSARRTPMRIRLGTHLDRAFPETPRRRVEIIGTNGDAPPLAPSVDDVRLVVVGEPLTAEHAESLRAYAEAGGSVLLTPTTPQSFSGWQPLIGRLGENVVETEAATYAMWVDVDFSHPLFEPFDDPRFADFTKIRFWRHRTVDETAAGDATVLARFDDGAPALIESRLGEGRVWLMTAGWHPADGQLARSSKFAPLLNAMLDVSRDPSRTNRRLVVGDDLAIERATAVVTPTGQRIELAANTVLDAAGTPGVYRVETPHGTQPVTVHLDERESRTATMPLERLEALGVPVRDDEIDSRAVDVERALARAEWEQRQQWWRWLVMAALVFVLLETRLASRLQSRRTQPTEEPSA